MGLNKYFIAVIIPQPAQDAVDMIKQELLQEHGLKGALRSPPHITLHRPFEWKAEKESMLREKLSSFRFQAPFPISLKDFGCFAPRVIFVNVEPSEELLLLHRELSRYAMKELRLLNETGDLRGFHPHVTVAFRDLRKNRFEGVWAQLRERKFEAKFSCGGFSLLRLEDVWREAAYFPFAAGGE